MTSRMNVSTHNYEYLQPFLKDLSLGDLQTEATMLTEEEEQYLFELLGKLYDIRGMKYKSIWAFLSLCFHKKSGVWLMAMYESSNISKKRFRKKKFHTQLKEIFSPVSNIEMIPRILQTLKIDEDYFYEVYQKWVKQVYLPQKQLQKNIDAPVRRYLPGQPIFGNEQYDSDPQTILYQHLADAFSDSDIRTIRSLEILEDDRDESFEFGQRQNEQDNIWDQDNTVSLGIKRKVQKNTYDMTNQSNRKKKRAKRPKKTLKKKQIMKKHYKQINQEKNLLYSIKNQREKLRKNRQYRHFIDDSDEETPRKRVLSNKKERRRPTRGTIPRRQGKFKPVQFDVIEIKSRRKRQIKNNFFFQINDQQEMDEQEYSFNNNQERMDSESSESMSEKEDRILGWPQKRKVKTKKLRKINKSKKNSYENEAFDEVSYFQVLAQPIDLFNDEAENMCIRRIKLSSEETHIDEEISEKFVISRYQQYLQALSSKQLIKEIKVLTDCAKMSLNRHKHYLEEDQERQIDEQIGFLLRLTAIGGMKNLKNDIRHGYIDPLTEFMFGKNLCKIIAEIIELLYNPTSIDTQKIQKYLRIFTHFDKYKQIVRQNQLLSEQLGKIDERMYHSFSAIVGQLLEETHQTEFMISFNKYNGIIKDIIKIQLKDEDYLQTVLTAVVILDVAWLKDRFKSESGVKSLQKNVQKCFQGKIRNKSQFLNNFIKIYKVYNIPISKQVKETIEKLAKSLDLSENQPDQFFICFQNLYRNFLQYTINSQPKVNPNPILRYLIINQLAIACKDQAKNKKIGNANDRNYNGIKMVMGNFSVLLEFEVLHTENLLKSLLKEMNNLNFQEILQENLLVNILQLLIQAYRIIMGNNIFDRNEEFYMEIIKKRSDNEENDDNSRNISNSSNLKSIENLLKKYLATICEKYNKFINSSFAQEKAEKYNKILMKYFDQFINNRVLSDCIEHYIFSIKLIFEICVPQLLSDACSRKNSLQVIRYIVEKINQYPKVEELLQSNREMEEQDEYQMFLLMMEFKEKKMKFSNYFAQQCSNTIARNTILKYKYMQRYEDMKNPQQKKIYELDGIITCLCLQNPENQQTAKTNLQKIVQKNSKQVKLVKNENGICLNTNELAIEFLKGFLHTMMILRAKDDKLDDKNKKVREGILDMIATSWYSKNARQLLKFLFYLPSFKSTPHFLSRYLEKQTNISENLCEIPHIMCTLSKIYSNQLQQNMNNKLSNSYLSFWKKVNQIYVEKQWKSKRSQLAVMFLQVFNFLLQNSANSQVTQLFKAYIMITDPKNEDTNNNFLKTIDIRHNNSLTVINLLRIIQEKNIQTLKNTKNYYFQYLINLDLKCSKFQYSRALLDEINDMRNDKIPFCSQIFGQVVTKMLDHMSLKEQYKSMIIQQFINILKSYVSFSSTLLSVFKQKNKEIENALKYLPSPLNVQNVINKYIITNANCDYGELASILQVRIRKNIRNIFVGNQTILKVEGELVNRIIGKLGSQWDKQVMQRYVKMREWIEQALNPKGNSKVQKILMDFHN